MTIGQRIRMSRKAKGMTQQELADQIGCTRKAISTYESGRSVGEGFYTIVKLCRALQVSADWLLGMKE